MKHNLFKKDMPLHLQSKYLFRGYRLGGSYTGGLYSLFKIHNETFNAWSILISIPISSYIFMDFFYSFLYDFSLQYQFPFVLLWISIIFHVSMSVCNHLFLPISKSVSNKWRKFDLCSMSISAMIGSYVFSIFVLSNFVCGFLLFCSFTYSLYSIFNIFNTDFTHCDVDRNKSTISIGISIIFFLIPILYSSTFYFSIIGSSYFVGALCFKYSFPDK